MTREQRIVFLTGLTFLLYALFNFFEKSIFVFPFPLNEPVLLIVSILFLKWNIYTKHRTIVFFFLLATTFLLLSQNFIWTLFLPSELQSDFYNSLTQDVFSVLYTISLLIFTYLFFNNEDKYLKMSKFIFLIFCGFILIGFFIPEFNFIGLLFISLIGTIYKIKDPIYNLLLLLFILNAMKIFTFWLYA